MFQLITDAKRKAAKSWIVQYGKSKMVSLQVISAYLSLLSETPTKGDLQRIIKMIDDNDLTFLGAKNEKH